MFLRARWRESLSVLFIALISIWILHFNFTGKIIPGRYGNGGSVNGKPSVQLRQGRIVGVEVEKGYPIVLEEFLGVPYAESTAGEGRFRRPVEIGESSNVFDASGYGHRCPAGAPDVIPQGEDCLNLNIYRPKRFKNLKKKIPVLVYFHGGSFNFGFGSNRQISNLVAWATEPFIGISFNYRVGALGFLSGSEVASKEGVLNLGLRDQEVLLQWVQDNIEEFGGDKSNVTLMGSSAGAHSIGHHLFHNVDEQPPFARVILESGAPTARACYSYNATLHTTQFSEFLAILGASSIPSDQLLGYLRQKDVNVIRRASETVYNKYNPSVRWPWQPVIDGHGGMVEDAPIKAWKTGRYHRVPILTGFNTDEGAMFVPSSASKSSDFTSFFKTLLPQLSQEDIEELEMLYPDPLKDEESPYIETRKGFGAQFARLTAAYGQFAYISPVLQTAHYATLLNDSAPLYLYHFAAHSSRHGADHASQAAWVTYNSNIKSKSETVNEISGTMHAYWTSFILTGDPNAVPGRWPQRRKWDAYQKGERAGRLLIFGKGNDEVAGGKLEGEVVLVEDDGFARRAIQWWSDRVGMFEV